MSLKTRGLQAINLAQFQQANPVEYVGTLSLTPPQGQQYILRMLIRRPFQDFQIPAEIAWVTPLVQKSDQHQQESIQVRHPYCYITIRSGLVESVTDDEWHTDGFSMNITHLPEQNYGWANCHPTEFVTQPIKFPADFSPFKHNVHQFIQDMLTRNPTTIEPGVPNGIYCFDPYVIHRRPQVPSGVHRAFIRISFTPIEIVDDHNTPNPLLPVPKYNRDALKTFRNQLERYPVTMKA
jgi:hypothetical protein